MIRAKDVILDRKKGIIEELGQDRVMGYYLGFPVETNRIYISPLRKDKNPSCSFGMSPGGLLYFHDFGIGKMYTCFSVVMDKFGINGGQALDRIIRDADFIRAVEGAVIDKKALTFDVIFEDISMYMDYWSKFGISLDTLKIFGVKAARTIFRDSDLYMRSTKQNPIFVYKFLSSNYKFYRPLSPDKKKKWAGNSTAEDIGGLAQLPKKNIITGVTSSMKDLMLLRELGFYGICLNSETVATTKQSKAFEVVDSIIKVRKKASRYVLLFMDNDDAGIKSSLALSSLYRIPWVTTPTNCPKDISDYYKKYGRKKTVRLVRKLIKKKVTKDDLPF